jgi:hypothetical protein
MSIRSDVGVAVKKELLAKLNKASRKFLKTASEHCDHKKGTLFIFRDYNHWGQSDAKVRSLSDDLDRGEVNNLLVVEACPEYPENDENDWGGWDDNPWNLRKEVSVSLAFEG